MDNVLLFNHSSVLLRHPQTHAPLRSLFADTQPRTADTRPAHEARATAAEHDGECEQTHPSASTTTTPDVMHAEASEASDRPEGAELLVVGGGGICFSFGTHLNQRIFSLRCPLLRDFTA